MELHKIINVNDLTPDQSHLLELLSKYHINQHISLIQSWCSVNKRSKVRRGRGQKSRKIHTENIDLTKFIKTLVTKIDGIDYLIDDNGIIYEHNETNNIVGHMTCDGNYNWF